MPALFRSVQPAWADANLGELARHIRSPLFLAHVRATTGTPVQQTNCHPFRCGHWLWAHNGGIREFATVRRDLLFAVDPELFPGIAGSTDSEVMFYLALTFRLEQDWSRTPSPRSSEWSGSSRTSERPTGCSGRSR